MGYLIDREFKGWESTLPGPATGKFFGWMVVISLLIHLSTAVFFLSQKGDGGLPQVNYIDLTMPLPTPTLQAKSTIAEEPSPLAAPEAPAAAPPLATQQPTTLETPMGPAIDSQKMQQNALSLGMNFGFFRSFADGESLRHEIREYYLTMLQKINESWWLIGGADPRGVRQNASIIVRIARNGDIIERKVVNGSGNAEYDRTILRALDVATPFPPLPESYQGFYFDAPLRLVVPSGLMLAGVPQEKQLP